MVAYIVLFDYFAYHISVLLMLTDFYYKLRWIILVIGIVMASLILVAMIEQAEIDDYGI